VNVSKIDYLILLFNSDVVGFLYDFESYLGILIS